MPLLLPGKHTMSAPPPTELKERQAYTGFGAIDGKHLQWKGDIKVRNEDHLNVMVDAAMQAARQKAAKAAPAFKSTGDPVQDAKLKKQVEAQRMRAEALAYLKVTGAGDHTQRADGQGKGQAAHAMKQDNTLELIRAKRALQSKEQSLKQRLLEQQALFSKSGLGGGGEGGGAGAGGGGGGEGGGAGAADARNKDVVQSGYGVPVLAEDSGAAAAAPPGWVEVKDPASEATYWWHVETNAVSREVPPCALREAEKVVEKVAEKVVVDVDAATEEGTDEAAKGAEEGGKEGGKDGGNEGRQ